MTQSIAFGQYQIHCSIHGEGEPLIFLHGWPANNALWEAQVATFKHSHRCIVFDWLGFGQSDKPKDFNYTFPAMTEMLAAVIDAVVGKDERLNIVAQDVGGPPAILWAHEHPARVKRFVLMNTILYPFSTFLDKTSHFFFGIPLLNRFVSSRLGLNAIMQIMTNHWGGGVQARIKNVLSKHKDWSHEVCLKTILEPMNHGRKGLVAQLEEKFLELTAEKFLVMAKKDPLCYAHMKELNDRNPEVPAHLLQSCGHLLAIDEPEVLTDLLARLLAGHKNS